MVELFTMYFFFKTSQEYKKFALLRTNSLPLKWGKQESAREKKVGVNERNKCAWDLFSARGKTKKVKSIVKDIFKFYRASKNTASTLQTIINIKSGIYLAGVENRHRHRHQHSNIDRHQHQKHGTGNGNVTWKLPRTGTGTGTKNQKLTDTGVVKSQITSNKFF